MEWLFDTTDFVVRGRETGWTSTFLAIYIIGNVGIFLAYVAISFMFIWTWRWAIKKPFVLGIAPSWIIRALAAVIFLGGISYLWDALIFVWTPYRFYVICHIITAIFSWIVAIGMLLALPKAMRDWDQAQKDRDAAISSANRLEDMLKTIIKDNSP